MGVHYGFIAVSSTVERFVDAFTKVWPQHELGKRATLSSLDGFLLWKNENESFVSARDWTADNPATEVYGFVQDGNWALLLDTSYALCSDKEALVKLSDVFGSAVSFIIETGGGAVSFLSFTQGCLNRSIDSVAGNVTTTGNPLPEEFGLPIDRFYVSEAKELQRRLGLRFPDESASTEVLGVAVTDRTDYSSLLATQPITEPRRKPWWQLW